MAQTSKNNLDILNVTKSALPRALFVAMHKKILGSGYELSLSFVSPQVMKKLSVKWMGDATHMNVLAFPLSKNSGEVVICTETAKKECLLFGRGCRQHIKYLVIHGMLHLDGFKHGSKMEIEEKRLMKSFGF